MLYKILRNVHTMKLAKKQLAEKSEINNYRSQNLGGMESS